MYLHAVEITIAAIDVFFIELGVVINQGKCDHGYELTYLGWELNTLDLTISCPEVKVPKIRSLLTMACE